MFSASARFDRLVRFVPIRDRAGKLPLGRMPEPGETRVNRQCRKRFSPARGRRAPPGLLVGRIGVRPSRSSRRLSRAVTCPWCRDRDLGIRASRAGRFRARILDDRHRLRSRRPPREDRHVLSKVDHRSAGARVRRTDGLLHARTVRRAYRRLRSAAWGNDLTLRWEAA